MNLNIADWKEFKISDLFELVPTKGKDSTELVNGNDISYIGAKKDLNGLMMRCHLNGYEDWVSKGNCIVFICLGAGSAGYTTYQKEDFIGMNGKTVCGYNENLNPEIGNFIVSVLDCERPKYSFGRSWTGDRLKNTKIKLPAKNNKPDWQFMEDYIKTLHYKPITTTNHPDNIPNLDISKWKEFKVGDLFPKVKVQHFQKVPETEGTIPFVSSASENNGISSMVNKNPIKGNCITVSTNGNCFDCFYQPNDFCISNDAEVLYNDNLNQYNGLFICSVLKQEQIKYSYGRKPKNDKVYETMILLPAKNDEPDWKFMENYIKSLPYGDKI